MPAVEANLELWEHVYPWDSSGGGETWSEKWGNSEALWFFTLYPRIHPYVPQIPSDFRILEIATGMGRWTEYLRRHCGSFIGIDLASKCIEHCRERFADDPRLEFHVTDGRDLAMVEDGSIDFAFSFDSLVHVDETVLRDYLGQLVRKLKPNGVGFIHHSNLGEFPPPPPPKRTFAQRAKRKLFGIQPPPIVETNPTWHHQTMTADAFAEFARAAGLKVISQEKINWVHPKPSNCISVFTQPGSRFDRPVTIVSNPNFMLEAELVGAHAGIYRDPDTERENAEREKLGRMYADSI